MTTVVSLRIFSLLCTGVHHTDYNELERLSLVSTDKKALSISVSIIIFLPTDYLWEGSTELLHQIRRPEFPCACGGCLHEAEAPHGLGASPWPRWNWNEPRETRNKALVHWALQPQLWELWLVKKSTVWRDSLLFTKQCLWDEDNIKKPASHITTFVLFIVHRHLRYLWEKTFENISPW